MEVRRLKIEVLNKGYVELVDYMGSDVDVVRTQRISYNKDVDESSDEDIKKFIFKLIKNGHESPFEHVVFRFKIKCPLFVQRQWFRHRIQSYNERSGRFTEYDQDFYIPDEIRFSNGNVEENDEIKKIFEETTKYQFKEYGELLDKGVQKELQRIILPMNVFTEFYWTINMRSLFNFLKLRTDKHSQCEIRQYQTQIMKLVEKVCPFTIDGFKKYVLNKQTR